MQSSNHDIKFLLLEKLDYIEEVSRKKAKVYGYQDNDILSSSGILTLVDNGVVTISKIAKKLGISRQAVHKSVKTLYEKGFLTLEEGEDRRERMICMTVQGEGLLHCRKEVMAKVESEIKSHLGEADFEKLKAFLERAW